jgi:hypothetical protein
MEADLRVSGGDQAKEVADLWEWMRAERGLAGMVRPVWSPPREGQLGGVVDVLAVALGSGGAMTALAGSLTAWLKTRRPDVTVTITTAKGSASVGVHNATTDQVLPLLQQAFGALDD